MTRNGRFWGVVGAVFATVVLAGCAGDDDKSAKNTIKIGMVNPQTGGLAAYGPAMESGARLAMKHINAAGGVLGKDIEIIYRDSKTSEEAAAAAARDLIDNEHVEIIVGDATSGGTIAASSIVSAAHVVQISGAASSPAVSTLVDDGYVFRTAISDAFQGLALADRVYADGHRSVALLYVDNAYGQGLRTVFSTRFLSKSGTTIVAEKSHPNEAGAEYDFATDLGVAYNGTSPPDAIVMMMYLTEGVGFLTTWNSQISLWQGQWYGSEGMKSTEIPKNVGNAVTAGMMGTAPTSASAVALAAFKAAYKSEFGEDSGVYSENYYDAVMIAALAIQKAGKVDGMAIRDALPLVANAPGTSFDYGQAKEALAAIAAGQDIDYGGPSGAIDFDSNGDVLGPIEVWRYTASGGIEQLEVMNPEP